jgi:hypothetical protein
VREQPQDHLQAAPACAQQRHLRLRVYLVGGQFRRDRVPGLLRLGELAAGGGDLALGGGDQLRVLGGGRDGRVGEQDREATLGGGQVLLRLADRGVCILAGLNFRSAICPRWGRRAGAKFAGGAAGRMAGSLPRAVVTGGCR